MPAQVDHDERRRELADVAIELIAEAGLDGASVRKIAARAGYSTVVVAHYFRNKEELLRQAFEHTIEQTARQIDAAMAGGADVRTALETGYLAVGLDVPPSIVINAGRIAAHRVAKEHAL